ncbi:hypothetical protein ABT039_29480 [Streptomyces lasiicapitis]|uniref:hypothetical protein n=1 Tax=Streptomyces lasiicapitis TaxID=1923961 RepID=UPI003330C70E
MGRLRTAGPRRMFRRAAATASAAAMFLGLALLGGSPAQAATWGHWVSVSKDKCLTVFSNDVVNLAPCEAGRSDQLWSPETISGYDRLIRSAAGGCLWARPLAGVVGAYRGDCDTTDPAKVFVLFSASVAARAQGAGRMTETQAWGNQVVVFSTTVSINDPRSHWSFRPQSG